MPNGVWNDHTWPLAGALLAAEVASNEPTIIRTKRPTVLTTLELRASDAQGLRGTTGIITGDGYGCCDRCATVDENCELELWQNADCGRKTQCAP
jgi:hypothetical protein